MKHKKQILCMALLGCFILAAAGCRGTETKGSEKNWQDTDFAMGTVIRQNIYTENGKETAEDVLDLIRDLEHKISWRMKDSQVAELNRNAGNGKEIPVDEDLLTWMETCKEVFERSGKALDITIGPIARLWDIGGDHPKVASEEEVKETLPLVDAEQLHIKRGKAELDLPGGQLDLGAVGKGIACDEIRDYADGRQDLNGTFSVGGSILVYGEKPDGTDWKIGVQDPLGDEGVNMGVLTLHPEEGHPFFVSTSGNYEKYIEKDGVRYHHIMDPRTGYPASQELISVTILSDNGLLSDALSTACYVLGPEEGRKLAEDYGVDAVFITKDQKVDTVGDAGQKFTILDRKYESEK